MRKRESVRGVHGNSIPAQYAGSEGVDVVLEKTNSPPYGN